MYGVPACLRRSVPVLYFVIVNFPPKYALTAKRFWWRPGELLNFLYSHRPNASSGPQGWHIRCIGGRRLAADTTRERHGTSARGGSRMSLCTVRARAMELISRGSGMGQNRRRSARARATYLENPCRSPTHRVLSSGAEMVDELAPLGNELACAVVPPPT